MTTRISLTPAEAMRLKALRANSTTKVYLTRHTCPKCAEPLCVEHGLFVCATCEPVGRAGFIEEELLPNGSPAAIAKAHEASDWV